MKKSELKRIIESEYKKMNEQENRTFEFTPAGLRLYNMFAHPHYLAFFNDLTSDPDFNPRAGWTDTFIPEIKYGSEIIPLLKKAGFIRQY